MRGLERPCHLSDIMAINRPHVGKTKLLEHGANLWHSETAHASFQPVELSWKFATHEGQMTDTFLDTSRDELHRRTEPGTIQNAG